MKVEQETPDLELVLWTTPSVEYESPSGAAAAMALVAFVAFTLGWAWRRFCSCERAREWLTNAPSSEGRPPGR